MYDFSGNWSCTVGLPAKSGVAGAICVVIPSVMGMCIFSPSLDKRGNSVRGVEFCKRASEQFGWSLFQMLVPNPGLEEPEEEEQAIIITPTNNSNVITIKRKREGSLSQYQLSDSKMSLTKKTKP